MLMCFKTCAEELAHEFHDIYFWCDKKLTSFTIQTVAIEPSCTSLHLLFKLLFLCSYSGSTKASVLASVGWLRSLVHYLILLNFFVSHKKCT